MTQASAQPMMNGIQTGTGKLEHGKEAGDFMIRLRGIAIVPDDRANRAEGTDPRRPGHSPRIGIQAKPVGLYHLSVDKFPLCTKLEDNYYS